MAEAPIQPGRLSGPLPQFGEHLIGRWTIQGLEQFLERAARQLFGGPAEYASG